MRRFVTYFLFNLLLLLAAIYDPSKNFFVDSTYIDGGGAVKIVERTKMELPSQN